MSLTSYELKKIFSKRITIIAIVLFVLLDVFKIAMIYKEQIIEDPLYNARQTLINKIEGPMTNEKISFVINKKNELEKIVSSGDFSTEYNPETYSGYIFGDSMIFKETYESLDYAYHYSSMSKEIIKKAEENKLLYTSNAYEQEKADDIIKSFSNRGISEFYSTAEFETYLGYNFSSLLILLLLMLTLSPVFSEEKESKMHLLILSSPKGKSSITFAKLSAGAAVCVLISVLLSAVDFTSFFLLFGFEGFSNPLYSLPSFAYTPFGGTIAEYIALMTINKIFGSIIFGFLFMLISCIFSSSAPSFVCSGAVVILSICANDFIASRTLFQLNPISFFIGKNIFASFSESKFFGESINSAVILTLFGLAVCLFAALLIFKIQKSASFTVSRIRRKKR